MRPPDSALQRAHPILPVTAPHEALTLFAPASRSAAQRAPLPQLSLTCYSGLSSEATSSEKASLAPFFFFLTGKE